MSWIITGTQKLDPDVAVYIDRVEAADGQALEVGVKDAINDFVVGCKSDGIWNAIKAACIMDGARTLPGALVPLVGPAPTNYNFVAGDYNRKTGLVGDGSTKYLDSNRANNADPESNVHMAYYATTMVANGTTAFLIGSASAGANDGLHIASTSTTNPNSHIFRCRQDSVNVGIVANQQIGLAALNRNSSSSYQFRNGGITTLFSAVAAGTTTFTHYIFGMNQANSLQLPAAARLAFYSIGEALDLAMLDTRVSALITAIDAAIP
jgi:hypothetical protein